MNKSNVVWMGSVRDLLVELDKLRSDVLAGGVLGWGGTVMYADGREVVYLGGTFKESSEDRARAMLKVSATRMMREDPPLSLRNVSAPK
jgi:hypothetical protein